MLAVFGDGRTPAPGTEEFQEWIRGEVATSSLLQANEHRYNPETGKFGKHGTDYGRYGSITVADWVKLGKPDRIGSHGVNPKQLEKLRAMSDGELERSGAGVIYTTDVQTRRSGIQKVLGRDGAPIVGVAGAAIATYFGMPFLAAGIMAATQGAQTYAATHGDWERALQGAAIGGAAGAVGGVADDRGRDCQYSAKSGRFCRGSRRIERISSIRSVAPE